MRSKRVSPREARDPHREATPHYSHARYSPAEKARMVVRAAERGNTWHGLSVGHAEPLPGVPGLLQLVDHGDGIVRHRDAALAFLVHQELIPS